MVIREECSANKVYESNKVVNIGLKQIFVAYKIKFRTKGKSCCRILDSSNRLAERIKSPLEELNMGADLFRQRASIRTCLRAFKSNNP